MRTPIVLSLALLTAAAHAGSRTSANYTIATDTTDAGGRRATSTAYTNDGSAGGIVGISTVAAPAETAKHGYVGQLYDVTGLTLTAVSPNVNEGATDQLGAWQALDDATFLAAPAASVAWGAAVFPISSISPAGLATAGTVYQNTPATVQGTFGGFTSPLLNLTVLDSIADNFGSYASDGVGDAWQVQYFGQPPNANAGPNADVSGTGQTNLFKYIAGLNPLDPNARFTLSIEPVPGQPGQKRLIFSPRLTDRTYTVKSKTDLSAGTWNPLGSSSVTDNAQERTVTDLSASGAAKFYRVEITKP